ncbi:MAG: thioredoxin family protein [Lentisphaeria bacterium]|nr:thioredoxin family protein [Lentisphaeria bacterium]
MTKKILILLLVISGIFYASGDLCAAEVVCDEETGICRLVDDEPESAREKVSKESTMLRKHLGFTGKAEFLAFLKGSEKNTAENTTFWGMILLALIGGIALNLTPCVLPMLPINLAIIGASGGKEGFNRGMLYGCGMAVTYGVLGILAAFAGVSFGALNSSPLFNFAIAVIFIILSLAMAGVFNFDPGSKFRVNPAKLELSKDMTALVMGGVSALLAGACVAPVVISVLIFAASNGWYGCFVPFALGIGMALPWPFAGAGLSVLPKPGKFMVVLKYIFAVIIFGAAVYYAVLGYRLLPGEEVVEAAESGFTALANAEKESAATGIPVLVKFTASWCKNCHAMDKTVLKDPEVANYIKENFIMVNFPAEDPSQPEIAALLKKYDIPGFPAFVILK